MKRTLYYCLAILILASSLIACQSKRSGKPKVLVFTKTAGFKHDCIPAGVEALYKLASENNFEIDTTSNAELFTEENLKEYSAVLFLNSTGDLLNHYQEADFERYIQAGGAYVGIHAASDAEYDWGWYGRLVGGYFDSHPKNQDANLKIMDKTNPAVSFLPDGDWKRFDEWYNFKNLSTSTKIILALDEKSYEGGTNGDHHPMAWYHEYDGGRAWYTGMGHTIESYSEPDFLKHILAGIQYAIGDNYNLDYSKAKTLRTPDEDRFTKTVLVEGSLLFEPTEFTILPDFNILVVQRRGEVLLYNNETKALKQIGLLNVYHKTQHTPGVNAEEGLMGVQADPNFAKNNFVYLFYSPADTSVNRLSRFTLTGDTLDNKTEKVILEFYSQREICCHTGGSITFGKDRMLYLSTGDNATPFDQPTEFKNNGYGPIDDRPDMMQYDARRSSGNTNDLRGKILRIKISEDGTYSIPEGNLFGKEEAKTRPEIYVMGNRNPYRISVDAKTGFLYWGEVGPDAGSDSPERGTRGYDEVNQARNAGFFGWPLFVGNNYPYRAYDYTTGQSGEAFDAKNPINNSKYNTGLQNLPPVQPAFIWYPYAASPEFPQVGTGGRNAMAGPVYHTDLYPKETRMPDYYNGKFFMYDWIRGWVKAVTMKPNGDFDKMEPFMPNTKFNSLIDMEVGPDGKIYILEYGNGWFSKNGDAAISRIDYNGGNRSPKITDFGIDKLSGGLPFTVTATAAANDPENDKLTYSWDFGDGTTIKTDEPTAKYTYSTIGEYNVQVTVIDDKNAESKSNSITLYSGNEAPVVQVNIEGNSSFYFAGKPVKYQVSITDKDDGGKEKDLSSLMVSADYLEGFDKAGIPQGHQQASALASGKNMVLTLDCKACHKTNEKSVGPAYEEISKRYATNPDAAQLLMNKIIKGGSGVWGPVAMAAHPDLKEGDVKQMVAWILSLSANTVKSLPASGSVSPTAGKPIKDNGVLLLSASYTDGGGTNIKPLSGSATSVLRNSRVTLGKVSNKKDFASHKVDGSTYLTMSNTTASFSIPDVDLSHIGEVGLSLHLFSEAVDATTFELRLDAPDGEKVGEFVFAAAQQKTASLAKPETQVIKTKINPAKTDQKRSLYLVGKRTGSGTGLAISALEFFAIK